MSGLDEDVARVRSDLLKIITESTITISALFFDDLDLGFESLVPCAGKVLLVVRRRMPVISDFGSATRGLH